MANEFKVKNGLKVDGSINLEEQGSTPSTPSAGLKIYAKTDKKVYTVDTTGAETEIGSGGAGGVNYIDNGSAEIDTTGWANYADAAAANPVDGTAGSATAAISVVTATTLRGTKHFRITKDAANRQGEGSSYAFTIDGADKAKVHEVSFDYLGSAAFVGGESSDVRVWVYDVTNSALIGITPHYLDGVSGSNHKFTGSFQSAPNSVSYRLIFHIATTNASAWTLDFDSVSVSPSSQMKDVGGNVSCSVRNSTTSLPDGEETLVIHPNSKFDTHSAYDTSTGIFVVPQSGYYQVNAYCILNVTGINFNSDSEYFTVKVHINDVSQGNIARTTPISGANYPTLNGSEVFNLNAGDTVKLYCHQNSDGALPLHTNSKMQIIQIPSPAATSSSGNVAFSGTDTSSTTNIDSGVHTKVTVATVAFDTHSAYSAGTWTCPQSGYYQCGCLLPLSYTGTAFDANSEKVWGQLYVNGSSYKSFLYYRPYTGADYPNINGSVLAKLNAGDTVEFYIYQDSDTDDLTLTSAGHIEIIQIDSKAVNVAEEKVVCATSACVDVLATATQQVLNFPTVDIDTHSGFTSDTTFTAPHSGYYRVNAFIQLNMTATTFDGDDEHLKLRFNVNDVVNEYLAYTTPLSGANYPSAGGSHIVKLNAGDTVKINGYQNSGSSLTLHSNSRMDISKI